MLPAQIAPARQASVSLVRISLNHFYYIARNCFSTKKIYNAQFTIPEYQSRFFLFLTISHFIRKITAETIITWADCCGYRSISLRSIGWPLTLSISHEIGIQWRTMENGFPKINAKIRPIVIQRGKSFNSCSLYRRNEQTFPELYTRSSSRDKSFRDLSESNKKEGCIGFTMKAFPSPFPRFCCLRFVLSYLTYTPTCFYDGNDEARRECGLKFVSGCRRVYVRH